MSNENTGNHNLTVKLIQENTRLQNANTLLSEAFERFKLIVKELEIKEAHFSQYINSKHQEINQIFAIFKEHQNNEIE